MAKNNFLQSGTGIPGMYMQPWSVLCGSKTQQEMKWKVVSHGINHMSGLLLLATKFVYNNITLRASKMFCKISHKIGESQSHFYMNVDPERSGFTLFLILEPQRKFENFIVKNRRTASNVSFMQLDNFLCSFNRRKCSFPSARGSLNLL